MSTYQSVFQNSPKHSIHFYMLIILNQAFALQVFSLTCPWWTIQNDSFRRLYSHLLVILWVCKWKLNRLLHKETNMNYQHCQCIKKNKRWKVNIGRRSASVRLTHPIPWSLEFDCPGLQCQHMSPEEPFPLSSPSPEDRCHPLTHRSLRAPANTAIHITIMGFSVKFSLPKISATLPLWTPPKPSSIYLHSRHDCTKTL